MTAAIDSKPSDAEDGTDADDGVLKPVVAESVGEPTQRSKKLISPVRRAALFGLAVVVVLVTLVGWLGFRAHQSQHEQARRSQYLQVARQGALNLTTIDWQHAAPDVQRILDGATGDFYDDFARRSKPFIEVLTQAKATTVGTITDAALESETADRAQVLVAVSVRTSNAGQTDEAPRDWRMRISVQRTGDQVKVSNIGFVP
jgi:Mce-associated membrane protein